MLNHKINSNLKYLRDQSLSSFRVLKDVHPLFQDLFKSLERYDFTAFKRGLSKQIKSNLKEWWINPDRGIDQTEKLYAILFEYDYYIFRTNVEAMSYGIGSWENFKTHTNEFDMGYNYDFAGFEAAPGLTLKYYDALETLANENLPEDLQMSGIYDAIGYQELISVYTFSGLVAIHEVFSELNDQGLFDEINVMNGFMILVGEHDSGSVYPVLIKGE